MAAPRRPSGRGKLEAKRKIRPDLSKQDIIWVGIAASEINLNRLAALLMFSDHIVEIESSEPEKPLPWEDPTDPRFNQPPELQVNYEQIKRDIVLAMKKKIDAGLEKPALKAVIQRHGADTLAGVHNDNLLALLRDIEEMT